MTTDILTEAAEVAAAAEATLQAEHEAATAEIMADFEAWLDEHHCPICKGTGEIRMQTGGRRNQWWAAQCSCRKQAA
jgi:hypothetical protein